MLNVNEISQAFASNSKASEPPAQKQTESLNFMKEFEESER